MKKLTLLLLSLLFISKANSQQPFEGILTITPDFKTKPASDEQIRVMVKGNKSIMEMPMEKGSTDPAPRVLSDRSTNEHYLLMETEGKKVAMKMNLDMMMGMAGGMPSSGQQPAEQAVKPDTKITSETRNIDGYTCKRVLSKMNESTSEAWVTDELNISMSDVLFSPNMSTSKQQYSHLPGLALEAWGTDGSGKIVSSMKIKPEKKSLDASMFEISSDYERMDMMQMMQGAQGDPQMMQQLMEMMGGKQ